MTPRVESKNSELVSIFHEQSGWNLAIDRTNWKFGQKDINVLVIAVIYHGVAFPLLFKLLPKFGNSNTNERIELIERFICLFGAESLDC